MNRKTVLVVVAIGAIAVIATGCNKTAEAPVESLAPIQYEETQAVEPEASYDNLEEPTTLAAAEGVVLMQDLDKDEVAEAVMNKTQEGIDKIYISSGLLDVNAQEVLSKDQLQSRENFLASLGLSEEELNQLTKREDIRQYLEEKGLTLTQIYGLSIYNYLLDAIMTGDAEEGAKKDYLTKTANMLKNYFGLDLTEMINCSTAEELGAYCLAHADVSGYEDLMSKAEESVTMSDEESLTGEGQSVSETDEILARINSQLWLNSIFPGINAPAESILNASTAEGILQIFANSGYTTEELKNASSNETGSQELVDKLVELEKKEAERKAKEEAESKAAGTTKSDVASTAETVTETLPDNGGSNAVTFTVNGGDFGYSTTTGSSSSSSSTNATGNITTTVGDNTVSEKIVVKQIVRNERAISYISESNSNLPGEIDTSKIPEDYEWVVVKFVVKKNTSSSSSSELIRPLVRVKNLSGGNSETGTATRVFYIEPEISSTSKSDTERTYYVAFWLPEDQENFYLYFGDTGGSVYKFKSSALKSSDDDD